MGIELVREVEESSIGRINQGLDAIAAKLKPVGVFHPIPLEPGFDVRVVVDDEIKANFPNQRGAIERLDPALAASDNRPQRVRITAGGIHVIDPENPFDEESKAILDTVPSDLGRIGIKKVTLGLSASVFKESLVTGKVWEELDPESLNGNKKVSRRFTIGWLEPRFVLTEAGRKSLPYFIAKTADPITQTLRVDKLRRVDS